MPYPMITPQMLGLGNGQNWMPPQGGYIPNFMGGQMPMQMQPRFNLPTTYGAGGGMQGGGMFPQMRQQMGMGGYPGMMGFPFMGMGGFGGMPMPFGMGMQRPPWMQGQSAYHGGGFNPWMPTSPGGLNQQGLIPGGQNGGLGGVSAPTGGMAQQPGGVPRATPQLPTGPSNPGTMAQWQQVASNPNLQQNFERSQSMGTLPTDLANFRQAALSAGGGITPEMQAAMGNLTGNPFTTADMIRMGAAGDPWAMRSLAPMVQSGAINSQLSQAGYSQPQALAFLQQRGMLGGTGGAGLPLQQSAGGMNLPGAFYANRPEQLGPEIGAMT